ncbi:MAG: hypothetical protein V5A44_06230 [Haloarculaceae archaeon]
MAVPDAASTFGSTVESLLVLGLKTVGVVGFVGFMLMLFGIPTYYNVTGGDYVEAAVGGGVLLVLALVILWSVYRRVDIDVALPSMTTALDGGD